MKPPRKIVLPPGPIRDAWKFQQYQFDNRLDRGKPRDLQAVRLDGADDDRGNTFFERLQRSMFKRKLMDILR